MRLCLNCVVKVDLVESCAKLREEKQHLKENYDEKYEGTLPVEKPKMTFGDAITKLKEGYKVRKVDWDESHYIYMDEEGYVRRRDGNKYFIKLNNDVWEEFK